MNVATKRVLWIGGISLAVGLLGDILLRTEPWGLNLPLWIAAVVAALLWLSRRAELKLSRESQWLAVAALLASAGLAWRASSILNLVDVFAIAVLFGLAANYARGPNLRQSGLTAYVLGIAVSYLKGLATPFLLLGRDIDWKAMPRFRWSKPTGAVLRGLLIALPLLLLFGGLFAAADPIFAQMTDHLWSWEPGVLFSHVALTLVLSVLAVGFLRTALMATPTDLSKLERSPWHLGLVDMSIVLGLLNLLFLAFVAIQFRYLFGGAALVEATTGLTYAQYARQGFFELVTVIALVLPLLLVGHWFLPADNARQERFFRWFVGVLIVQLFVVMASALLRMWFYVQNYGLTELRFYSTAFMGWLAVLLLWFVLTVLRGRRNQFAFGVLVSGLALLGVLHVINPDSLIVRTNLARAAAGERFDAEYNAKLSPDAIPTLIQGMDRLNEWDCRTVNLLLERRLDSELGGSSFLSWNFGRSQAAQAIENDLNGCVR